MAKGNDMSAAREARVKKAKARAAKVEKMQAIAAKARAARVGGTAKTKTAKVPAAKWMVERKAMRWERSSGETA
jgi:hypothetical protein